MNAFKFFCKKHPKQMGQDTYSFSKKSIYSRLFYAIIISLIIPCIVIGVWSNLYAKNIILKRHMNSYLDNVYENLQNGINDYIDQVTAFSIYILDDGIIYDICKDPQKDNETKKEEIRNYLNKNYQDSDLTANIDIVMKDGFVIRQKDEDIESLDLEFRSRIRHTTMVLSDNLVKNQNGENFFVFGRSVISNVSNKKIFDIYLYVPEAKFFEMLVKLNNNGNLFYITANDKIICGPNKSDLGCRVLLPQELSDHADEKQQIGDYIYDCHTLKFRIDAMGDWQIQSYMNYKWFYSTINVLRNTIIMTISISIVLAILLAIVIPISLIKAISLLQKRMKAFSRSGKDDEEYRQFNYKEIAELEASFNGMVVEINNLIEKNNIEKEKQRRAEMKALQAQINPHFLYNALDSITWYAKLNKQDYIADMIFELATFFRIALHKGDTFIKASEEIRHVESYVAIEQMRFPDLFCVEYKIQEDIADELMLKIILQPIVENCIKHGFSDMDKGGIIKITGYTDENDDIVFEVEDNGCGIAFDPLSGDSKTTGYGLINVNERIMIEYGSDYGLSIKGVPGRGTIVRVKLKKRQDF